jgi:Spy/CpxP family protein refolding chaperone
MVLLTAPSIDRGALEQLRISQIQAADAMSQRTLKAMADATEVLSAEQRSRLAERMKQRMSRRGHGG